MWLMKINETCFFHGITQWMNWVFTNCEYTNFKNKIKSYLTGLVGEGRGLRGGKGRVRDKGGPREGGKG